MSVAPLFLSLILMAFTLNSTAFADDDLPPPPAAATLDSGEGLDTTGAGLGSPMPGERPTASDIFGGRTGYFHPFLSLGGFHSDNLFRTASQEKSDWVTVITPGFWLSLPASHQKLLEISVLNTAPGGLAVSRFRTDSERRFQGYALYRADILEYQRYDEENRIDHRGEGLFKISLRGGLSLELVDVYEVNRDPYGTAGGANRQLDRFTANLFSGALAYQLSPKLMLRADYGNFSLDYDAARNAYRDRTDRTYAASVYYQATPKSALFLEYQYIDVEYDVNSADDSVQTNYFLGFERKMTARMRALVKIGYGSKDYDQDNGYDRDAFLVESQVDFAFTPKTSMYLRGTQKLLETDQLGARNILSKRVQFGYRQKLMAKLRAEVSAFYLRNDYDGASTIGLQTAVRKDDEYGAVLALGYSPVRWGNLTLGYEYRQRDSNFDTEDYQANTIFLRFTVAL